MGRSRQGVEELLMQGHETLKTLRDQRGLMKNIRKRMLDMTSTLGMSNTVMRLIERRSEGDKYVLFGGMIMTWVIIYLVVRYFTWVFRNRTVFKINILSLALPAFIE